MVALWALAACGSETLAQKTLRLCNSQKSCPGHSGACNDEAYLQQNIVAPAEAAGCTKTLDALLNCSLGNACGSYGPGATACTAENNAHSVCLVAKTCGNGTCDTGEYSGNCPSDCASS